MSWLIELLQLVWFQKFLASVIWIIAVILLRDLLLRTIGYMGATTSLELKRRMVLMVRNIATVLLFGGLFVIWATELRSFAVAVVAVLLAIVIGTKEVLTCVLGGFYRALTHAFSLGDRIEVDGLRGDVVDHNLLGTTVMEVGPSRHSQQYTGRAIVIPNSRLLMVPLVNESYHDKFVIHSITIPMSLADDWEEGERKLLQIAEECAGQYVEEARTYFSRLSQREGIEAPAVEPRIIISLPTADRVDLIVRVSVPPGKQGAVEQKILHGYLRRSIKSEL